MILSDLSRALVRGARKMKIWFYRQVSIIFLGIKSSLPYKREVMYPIWIIQ
jgi:hypothetical protein